MNSKLYDSIEWSEVVFLSFVYALYILVVTAPLGFIISGLKVYRFKKTVEKSSEMPSQEMVLIATHHEWLVRTFIGMLFLSMAALGTIYYMIGFLIAGAALVWWFYRLIRGASALVAHREMPATICTKAQCYGEAAAV